MLGLPPVVKIGFTTLVYKFLAALVQPVSDKRMVGCLSTVGEGCRLLMKVLLMTELLFIDNHCNPGSFFCGKLKGRKKG